MPIQRSFAAAAFAAALACAQAAHAAVSVPSLFGDHMVLQARKPAHVWGTADPGETVTVSIGGQTAAAQACSAGRWNVVLAPLSAGGPLDMTIAGASNTIAIADVLVGEVWIGSGQSNMQWSVSACGDAEAEIAAAQHPQLRLFSVERKTAAAPQDNCAGAWTACTPETVKDFSAVLYYFGRELHGALGTPVGLVHSSWGGTPAEAWTSREALAAEAETAELLPHWAQRIANYPADKAAFDEALKAWKQEVRKAKKEDRPEPPRPNEPFSPESPWVVSSLYNAMIAPLVPYAMQGVVWYQGESNAPRAEQYRTLFPAMIRDWRRAWGEPFSFYFVQLANFTKQAPEPGENEWAELREAQAMTLAMGNTGMAVAIDIGEAGDIHPKNKQDVGRRLAYNALAKDYGMAAEFSGPRYTGTMKAAGGRIVLHFDHAAGLAARGEKLEGFAVAGADRKFVWADASVEGETVIVSSPQVAEPVAVRYAWAANPKANLYNGAGLPASPFRTDNWPGLTAGKRVP